MEKAIKDDVRRRAEGRCEYCGIAERYFTQRFQIEHIRPRSHRGTSTLDNLALACERCNLHKGPNVAGYEPESEELTPLFNPRVNDWNQHFELESSGEFRGLTPIGRTIVEVLAMNDSRRVELRRAIIDLESKEDP
jgi:uncharacterized protein (TIGR02646 family)